MYCSREQTSSCQHVSNQDISLSHGIPTDLNVWTSTLEINEINNCPSSETTTGAEPQNTPPVLYSKREPTPTSPDIQEVESNQKSADRNEKKQDGPLALENKVSEGNSLTQKLNWEVLVQEVVTADCSLARTLYPIANRKTALMLMEQLLSEDTLLMEEHYKKKLEQNVNNPHRYIHLLSTTFFIEHKFYASMERIYYKV